MTEGYCGRSCENCEYKEQYGCYGCKDGPGKDIFDSCEVASCCRIMKQESCEICSSRSECEKYNSHQSVPDYIKDKLNADYIKREKIKERVKYAGKLKMLLYWGLAHYLISILTNDYFVAVVPELEIIGLISELVCMFASALILLRMAPAERGYNFAGYFQLGYIGACILALLLPAGANLLVIIVGTILYCIGDCRELKAHGAMHSEIDDKMERRWMSLYKWLIGMYCLLLCSLVLLFVNYDIGEVVLNVAALGMFAVILIRIEYLRESARLFAELAKETVYQDETKVNI